LTLKFPLGEVSQGGLLPQFSIKAIRISRKIPLAVFAKKRQTIKAKKGGSSGEPAKSSVREGLIQKPTSLG
jgi:hypothetical protein